MSLKYNSKGQLNNIANISCSNCKYFYMGLGMNEGKKCTKDNVTSLLGVDTRVYSCSKFENK